MIAYNKLRNNKKFIIFFIYFIMTRYSKTPSGHYLIHGKKYEILEGSRAQVMHGTAYKTSGGLKKHEIIMNKNGRIVSKKKHMTAKKEKRLVKAGYLTKKGQFGFVKVGKTKKMKGGKGYQLSPMDLGEVVPSSPYTGTGGSRRGIYGGTATAPTGPTPVLEKEMHTNVSKMHQTKGGSTRKRRGGQVKSNPTISGAIGAAGTAATNVASSAAKTVESAPMNPSSVMNDFSKSLKSMFGK